MAGPQPGGAEGAALSEAREGNGAELPGPRTGFSGPQIISFNKKH